MSDNNSIHLYYHKAQNIALTKNALKCTATTHNKIYIQLLLSLATGLWCKN